MDIEMKRCDVCNANNFADNVACYNCGSPFMVKVVPPILNFVQYRGMIEALQQRAEPRRSIPTVKAIRAALERLSTDLAMRDNRSGSRAAYILASVNDDAALAAFAAALLESDP